MQGLRPWCGLLLGKDGKFLSQEVTGSPKARDPAELPELSQSREFPLKWKQVRTHMDYQAPACLIRGLGSPAPRLELVSTWQQVQTALSSVAQVFHSRL